MSGKRKAKRKQKRSKVADRGLPVLQPHVAGIDIGSREHWVAAPPDEGKANVLKFGTTTPELEMMTDWLQAQGVESVAMESTGVYWIPAYELLESRGLEVILVNAREVSQVPGRKTDFLDCQWLQLLHSCGLLKGSFRPSESICELRAVQRERSNFLAERSRMVQRMQKALDQMNVQVHRALSDITGATGMKILRAIVSGERDPLVLAAYRDRRCRKSEAEIAEYLTGNWREEHLFNLEMNLRLYDQIEAVLLEYDTKAQAVLSSLRLPERVDLELAPHPHPVKHKAMAKRGELPLRTLLWQVTGVDLTRIDGIAPPTAQVVISEIGLDLSRFPAESNFISWLKLAPRVPISAGKPLRKRKQGMAATRLANALRMAALSLKHSNSALGAYYRNVARKKDGAVAVFATARKLAQLIYRALKYGHEYLDQGAKAYEQRFRQSRIQSLTRSAFTMGYQLVPIDGGV